MKRKSIFPLVTAFVLIITAGCNDLGVAPIDTLQEGRYQYLAYDEKDNLVAEGIILIDVSDTLLTGIKNIRDTGEETQPETGVGAIIGETLGENKAEIYLLWTGGPVLLIEGYYKDETFRGKRIYYSETGAWIDTLGNFVAKLIEDK